MVNEIKKVLPANEQAFIITNMSPRYPELIKLSEVKWSEIDVNFSLSIKAEIKYVLVN